MLSSPGCPTTATVGPEPTCLGPRAVSDPLPTVQVMLIDCESCAAKPAACTDCVVTVLLGMPGSEPDLDATEQRAIDALAGGGLIPPLRLVPIGPPRVVLETVDPADERRTRPHAGRTEPGAVAAG